MGLDIYFYRVKTKKLAQDFITASKAYDTTYDKYYTKYKIPLKEASQKWNKWYNAECDRISKYADEHPDEEPIDFDYSKEPKYSITDYMDELEKADWQLISTKYNSLRTDINMDDDYDDLYMRKQNWMVHFVENIHPERLVQHKEFGKILAQGMAILTKDDIKELLNRINKILGNVPIRTYTEETGLPQSEDGVFNTEEFMEWQRKWKPAPDMLERAIENLPTMGRFMFGSLDYDYHYFTSLEYYKSKFENWLKIADRHEVLLYDESW